MILAASHFLASSFIDFFSPSIAVFFSLTYTVVVSLYWHVSDEPPLSLEKRDFFSSSLRFSYFSSCLLDGIPGLPPGLFWFPDGSNPYSLLFRFSSLYRNALSLLLCPDQELDC